MNLTHSMECYERAAAIGGRSLTRSKAPGKLFDVGAGPLYAASGSGPYLYDVDGNRYLDMICALGAISLGYGGDESMGTNVVAMGQVQRGWTYSLPSHLEGRAAEAMLSTFAPWASQVRFVKTGSEALTAAVMIARKATGRRPVLVADGSYHGWHAWTSQRGERGTDGEYTFTYPYGVYPVFGGASLPAAVIVEPARWEQTPSGYLRLLHAYAVRIGALFIVDDLIYGGRWAKGGAEEYFGIKPDLACYGKAIGNGAPIACVVGNDALKDHGEIVSGTYSGDAAALAAVIEVARVYDTQPVIETLWARGRQLAEGLQDAIAPYPGTVREGAPVHQRLRFADPRDGRRFAAAMAQRGVLWHPDVVNLSFAHTKAHITEVIEAATASLAAMAKIGSDNENAVGMVSGETTAAGDANGYQR